MLPFVVFVLLIFLGLQPFFICSYFRWTMIGASSLLPIIRARTCWTLLWGYDPNAIHLWLTMFFLFWRKSCTLRYLVIWNRKCLAIMLTRRDQLSFLKNWDLIFLMVSYLLHMVFIWGSLDFDCQLLALLIRLSFFCGIWRKINLFFSPLFIHCVEFIGKPVDPDHLRKIESIVNEQIKAELDVFAKDATLAEAKRINGLRAVFGEVR